MTWWNLRLMDRTFLFGPRSPTGHGEIPHYVRNDSRLRFACSNFISPTALCERRAPQRAAVLSPIEAPESGNKIKVPVPAYKREGMLAAERGDPEIVGGNGLAFPFQFEPDG